MCKYCEKHAQWGDYEVDNLSIREESKYNYGCYTGIQSFIDVDDNVLIMCAVVDDKNVKPLQEHVYVPINYCPKCGRKLNKKQGEK